MRAALREALKAYDLGEVPVGAVIVKDEKIVARGHNLKEYSSDPTAHAEVIAVRKASRRLKNFRLNGCEIYITVEPCLMCLGAIVQSRMKRVVFSAKNPREGAFSVFPGLSQLLSKKYGLETVKGPFVQKSASILKRFFKKLR